MGLFSKLKTNFTHGGVKVQVSAPSSVMSNQIIPVTITVTAGDQPQTITTIKAEVKAQAKEQGMNFGGPNGGVGMNNETTVAQTIAVAESRDPIALAPGESRTVQLELFINGNTGNPNQSLGNNAIGNALESVAAMATGFGHVNYIYTVHGYASIEGVALSASDKQPITLLPPSTQQPTTVQNLNQENVNPSSNNQQPPAQA